VIVAAFDAMPYVTRCISSVLAQTLGIERIELIAIDDGSTDGTGAELDRFAAGCPTMRVVHQANSGSPARPRNLGLGMATGRYVFFLDADDYLGPEAFGRMLAMGDANGSDMVLGRLVGIGGRKAPRSIFRVNQPHADLFRSRVFWSLNPMKLFRRAYLQKLGLTFATDLPWGEDMPFVAEAYLRASVISIVADYDCVYLTYRDDGNNFTKRVSSMSSRLATPTRLLEMTGRHVRPGRNRDYLMSRVFQLEVINILPRMAQEPDPVVQRAGFETIKGWVDRWYTRPIAYPLSPLHRIALNLVRRGKLPEVAALFPEWPPTRNWDLLLEGDRVFADYPYFRDPALAVPDSCYEVTRKLKPHCHLDRVSTRDGAVTLTGYAYTDVVDTLGMRTFAVLRRRGGGGEYAIPATPISREGLGTEEWNRKLPREDAGFEVRLDPATAAGGDALSSGWWDISVRTSSEGVTREAWTGAVSCGVSEGIPIFDDQFLRQVDADPVAPGDESALVVDSVAWSAIDPSVLEITGRCEPSPGGASSLSLALLRREGGQHRQEVDAVGGRFATRLTTGSIAAGRPLEDGTWDVVLERREGDEMRIFAVPVTGKLRAVYRLRGLWPDRTRVAGPGPAMVLSCERLDPARVFGSLRARLALVRSVFKLRN
jgi:CDP-glycerol glycerophosphotransferase